MAFTAKLKSMFGAQDMTSGKIMDCLINFSVPDDDAWLPDEQLFQKRTLH